MIIFLIAAAIIFVLLIISSVILDQKEDSVFEITTEDMFLVLDTFCMGASPYERQVVEKIKERLREQQK